MACFALVFIVLLQKGKGADLAGAFGGGGSQTALGVRSATQLIHKMTIAAAVFFMITSYTLGMMQSASSGLPSLDTVAGETQETTPADAETGDENAQTPAGDESEQEQPADDSQEPASGGEETEGGSEASDQTSEEDNSNSGNN